MTGAWMSFTDQSELNKVSFLMKLKLSDLLAGRPCTFKKKIVCVFFFFFSLFPRSSFCLTSSVTPSFALTCCIIAEGKLCYGIPQSLEPTQLNDTTIPFNTLCAVQGHIKIGPVRLTKMAVDFISVRLVV